MEVRNENISVIKALTYIIEKRNFYKTSNFNKHKVMESNIRISLYINWFFRPRQIQLTFEK